MRLTPIGFEQLELNQTHLVSLRQTYKKFPLPSTHTDLVLQGVTRLLLTKIPHYREIILLSFTCHHCGQQNNEIQSGEKIQVGLGEAEARLKF